jgi:hypothetical protein
MVSASAHLGRWVQRHSVLAKAASWDTNYETTEKIFGPEMTPAQRESAIKELQSETKKQ